MEVADESLILDSFIYEQNLLKKLTFLRITKADIWKYFENMCRKDLKYKSKGKNEDKKRE